MFTHIRNNTFILFIENNTMSIYVIIFCHYKTYDKIITYR